jgi:hypothetical protein
MRLYTTTAYKHMNVPLRDDARYSRSDPCPLPVATFFANQADTSTHPSTHTQLALALINFHRKGRISPSGIGRGDSLRRRARVNAALQTTYFYIHQLEVEQTQAVTDYILLHTPTQRWTDRQCTHMARTDTDRNTHIVKGFPDRKTPGW